MYQLYQFNEPKITEINIIKKENLLENVTNIGNYLKDKLHVLQDKYEIIGDVRGKDCFVVLS